MEVFVVLSFRWLNLEGFYVYAIQRKKPSHACEGFMTAVSGTFKLSKSSSFAKAKSAFTLCYRGHLNLQGFENLGGFCGAVISLVKPSRFLCLCYSTKKALTRLQGLYDSGFGNFQTFQK
ncbi:MAG: hypothetical protein GDA51_14385 [Ekhidna sp.]|nr:hypothetical protein [Ekhidna sp.]